MRLRYTNRAARELEEILAHIEMSSPRGAMRVKRRLSDAITVLMQFPRYGRLTSKRDIRRITVLPYPYVIFYQATADDITIHVIRHTARKPLAPTQS